MHSIYKNQAVRALSVFAGSTKRRIYDDKTGKFEITYFMVKIEVLEGYYQVCQGVTSKEKVKQITRGNTVEV